MQLYTVKMTTKQIVSRYDDKGVKVEELVMDIPVTFHDLPLQTAQMYREKNPDGNVQIVQQIGVLNSERARPAQFASTRSRSESTPRASSPTKSKPAKSNVADAARSGDMSAAINHQ